MDTDDLKSSSPTDDNHSASSDPLIDIEEHELSDDDDRNHKHRRREAQPPSFDNNSQEQPVKRASGKRKPFENGQMFHGNQSTNLDRATFEKRRPMSTTTRFSSDSGPRGRVNQTFHADPGPRFDISASMGRPFAGRGRGRNIVAWGQHDSRFSPLDSVDFASQIASQGPSTHPGLFIGTGLPGAANMQTPSWGAYGFIPGMGNRILDPLHQLSLQGLQPARTTLMNSGIPRQRCRDFEERGFCLRGDICPMEHGINRIVVEDVQSLSQFNLPIAAPSSHAVGVAGQGSLPPISASLMEGNMPLIGKDSMGADVLEAERVSTAPGDVEADVYDPDQPLWDNECHETSNVHLRLPSPDGDEQHLWAVNSSMGKRQHNGVQGEYPNKVFLKDIGSHGNNSSVWGRIGHGNNSEMEGSSSAITTTSDVENETKEENKESALDSGGASQVKNDNKESISKTTGMQPLRRPGSGSGHSGGKISKALRTLYVQCIPQKSNKKESLLSHFQKFGKVVHIYIPLNSEIAFVQFSKKEEAEAALNAPDAVMGNRFIKLWWANRDRVSDEEGGSFPKKFHQSSGKGGLSLQSKEHGAEREEGATSASSKGSRIPSIESPLAITGFGRDSSASSPKTTISVQKKMESLELLEELRKKQEMLAQKRDEFRRQLDKFEKQAVSVKKAEHSCEQTDKKHELDLNNEVTKPITPTAVNAGSTRAKEETGKLQKTKSGGVPISPNFRATVMQNPNIMQISHVPALTSSRFKLDNRPTTFRVLHPLPDGFADVAVLKDHFSSYGDLSSVVLEDPEGGSRSEGENQLQNYSARVVFKTRASAERAYLGAQCWQGHSLQFMWLPAPHSKGGLAIPELSNSSRTFAGGHQSEHATCESSSSQMENSVNSGTISVAAILNESNMLGEVTSASPSDVAKSYSKVSCPGPNSPNETLCEEPHCISENPS